MAGGRRTHRVMDHRQRGSHIVAKVKVWLVIELRLCSHDCDPRDDLGMSRLARRYGCLLFCNRAKSLLDLFSRRAIYCFCIMLRLRKSCSAAAEAHSLTNIKKMEWIYVVCTFFHSKITLVPFCPNISKE